ncbi:MAG: SDR family NAD(P)-dependent oxidoreductase [Deltaproteobacteria bacterium]|nr:SDR family NAD(P)-dependent oxidoreductase [Deltaproteobacteria bacterium]
MTTTAPSQPTTDVVLVTGAASGIGRATALAFAARGAQLVVCDVDRAGLESLAAELGPRCLMTRVVDVADRAAMKALADEVHALVPALDVLVNNAGVAVHGGILDTSLDDWDWLLGINLRGVIHGCHFFVPPMVARGRGHVVNVSSTYGFVGGTGVLAYVTSKFGVFGLSESLRAELRDKGVGVSTICPGMIKTNIVRRARFLDHVGREESQAHAVRLFDRRGAPPERVAQAIVRAVEHRRDVVPVAAEAWILYGLKRVAPRLTSRLVALLDSGRARQALAGKK